MAKSNPLDAFVAPRPSSFPSDFRLPPMPKLLDSIKSGVGFMKGLEAHDQALEQWRQNAEKSINERITQPSSTATATTTTAPAATVTPVTETASEVTSVNSKTGDVSLTTDDIPPTSMNQYLTGAGWLNFFDHLGFIRTDIPVGDSVYVPVQRAAVIPGPFTVEGSLTVDGVILFLPL